MPKRERLDMVMILEYVDHVLEFRPLRLQLYACFEDQRRLVCRHTHTPYRGQIPCIGPKICTMCGMLLDPIDMRPLREHKWTTYEGKSSV